MFYLTLQQLFEMTPMEARNITGQQLSKIPRKDLVESLFIDKEVKGTLLVSYDTKTLNEYAGENALVVKYTDPSGTERSYIPLDDLRQIFQEWGKRHVADDFKVGKESWRLIMKMCHIGHAKTSGRGSTQTSKYMVDEDLPDEFIAENARTSTVGFNYEKREKFFKDYGEDMLKAKRIAEESAVKKVEIAAKAKEEEERIDEEAFLAFNMKPIPEVATKAEEAPEANTAAKDEVVRCEVVTDKPFRIFGNKEAS